MSFRIPFARVNWITSSFLLGTLALALTAVPWYLWRFGADAFLWTLFAFYVIATGLSITLGYHRLFSHLSFRAHWSVKLFTLLFGAAAFENSALDWASDHRKHHKHVDHDDDPYDITKGFFYAHIGWLLFKLRPEPPMDNVGDLQRDPLVMWQHRYVQWIGTGVGFVLPLVIGYAHNGWVGALGGFLLAGVLRVVLVQHSTFCINSVCHTIGKRPYSTKCSARDSGVVALITFGEGYHNFHHEFQHDYRNGVKPWQWDPTKWTIWTLSKLGLVEDLRRVEPSKILLAELIEARRQIDSRLTRQEPLIPEHARHLAQASIEKVKAISNDLALRCHELQEAARKKVTVSRRNMRALREQVREAFEHLDSLQAYTTAQPA